MIEIILCLVVGYFCGCISTGYFVGKFFHKDIRELGSGNAGTTNVLRNFGVIPAIITFVGDLAKAIIPILLLRHCIPVHNDWYLLSLYCGLGVVLGHNYPFYLGFKGGKGIAVTAAVVMSAANPIMIPIGLAHFCCCGCIDKICISRFFTCGMVYSV